MPRASTSVVAKVRADTFPDNPVLTRVWRDGHVESQHRGAWVLVDAAGHVHDGAGDWKHPIFARSSSKSLQALPLIESGAAERFGFDDAEIALALSSHDAEACHTERVAACLARIGLSVGDLRCGSHEPGSVEARNDLIRAGRAPTAVHNNCSGKHAGFLALALQLGVEPARYVDAASAGQQLVRRAVEEMTAVNPSELSTAIDGCSAPTFRLPLRNLATGIARVANPEGLAAQRRRACERMTRAVAAWPELIAGSRGRFCTDLVRASGGRLFPKLGTEAVYVVGVRGQDRGLAVKIDDGHQRGMHALVVALLERFGFLGSTEVDALRAWTAGPIANLAGLDVGRVEVVR